MKNNVFYDNFIRLCNHESKPPSIVADELGLSRAAVSKWKDGAVPYRATILKIADYFDVDPESLLSEEFDISESKSVGYSTFYNNYVRLCAQVKKSPSAVAEEMGFSRTSVSRWKKMEKPRDATALRVANYFNVPLESLFVEDSVEPEQASNDNSELEEYLEELRNRSEVRMLLSVTKDATKADVERAVAIIEALRKSEGK